MHSADVDIRLARDDDHHGIAALRHRWRRERGEQGEDLATFEHTLGQWMHEHRASHVAFIAVRAGVPVGMAWLAVVERVPGPERFVRRSGDVQSVYVVPEARGHGVGADLALLVIATAREMGLAHLSLHPSERAVPLYQRLGFEGSERLLGLQLT
jgi:GNAT superfamily N-acetyltransferase